MPPISQNNVAEFRDWSIAAVRLLQGAVYMEDGKVWEILLRGRTLIEAHLARIGLTLVVDETDGYAYARQWRDDECPEGYEQLPKLVRRVPLGYAPTLLAVLLRDELRRHDEQVHHERCVVEANGLFEQWKAFFPPQHDEVRQRREFAASMNKLADLGLVRHFGDTPEQWEVRPMLKARLSAAELDNLRTQLATAANRDKAVGAATLPSGGETGHA